ncbi:hypothetical protein [Pedobacter ureilyticus]|jgi:hypothetical protein|uniref:DUF4136 domain-containing protein n=1 Tax=Pedobacter ureilyticus TaxID=1393051 RepID=A0ABW9J1F0_9SPHI|nr:hypothetical protein [Pedobacter helvus]
MKKLLSLLVFVVLGKITFGQTNKELYISNYPNGIYTTKADFVNKLPNDTSAIVPKNLPGKKKDSLTLEQNTFFYTSKTDKKIKNVFAVVYNNHIFFNIASILSNRNKTDRSQNHNNPNSFVGVLIGGNNYLYTEANLANAWAQGFAYGMGGAIGGIAAQGMIYGKGIVWDVKNEEFNIFKNCKDYNEFIKDKYPSGVQECKNNQPDVLKIRADIKTIL